MSKGSFQDYLITAKNIFWAHVNPNVFYKVEPAIIHKVESSIFYKEMEWYNNKNIWEHAFCLNLKTI